MDHTVLFSKNLWLHKQIPLCMTKPECQCFEVLLKYINADLNPDDYILQSIEQIEKFIYLVRIHQNKEAVIEIPYAIKVEARILKKMISYIHISRKMFVKTSGNDTFCYIDFPIRSVQILQYLNYIDTYCNYVDTIITSMLLPSSKIYIDTLKVLLEIHMELLFVFEQYQRMKKFGYTFASETSFGTKNMIQLFYGENK